MHVSPWMLACLALTGFVAGGVDAVAGGGGLLTMPALLAAGLPPHVVLGTNKGQSTFGSLAALHAYAARGTVDRRLAIATFPAAVAGALAGSALVVQISPAALKPLVVGLLPIAALTLFVRRRERTAPMPARRVALASSIAFVIGMYDGFFGPGTGTFLIVAFSLLTHPSLLGATADAKVVNVASNAAALALFAGRGLVLWQVALPMAAAQIAGGFLGARLALRGGEQIVRATVLVVTSALFAKLVLDLMF